MILKVKLHPQKHQINHQCHADGVRYNLGVWSRQAAFFQVCAAKVRKLLTDLLHGHETENTKSHLMLVSQLVKRQLISLLHSDRGLSGVTMPILKTMMEMKAEYHPTEMTS